MPLTPTLVQSVAPAAAGGATQILATLNGTTAGNLLIIAGCCTTSGAASISFSDGTNTYNNVAATVQGNSCSGRIGYAMNIAGGNVTVTVSSTVSGTQRAIFQEWANVVTAGALDQNAQQTGTGLTPTTPNSGTLQQSGELVVAYAFDNTSTNWSLGTGYSADPTVNNGAATGRQAEYLISTNTAAQAGSFTMTNNVAWCCMLATFLPASSPGVNVQMFNRRYVLFNT